MDGFEEYISYVLIREGEKFSTKKIYVSSEKLDTYVTENNLLIAPKLKGYSELVEWLNPINRDTAIKEALNSIPLIEFDSIIHKSTELIKKRNEFIKKHSKIVDLDLIR